MCTHIKDRNNQYGKREAVYRNRNTKLVCLFCGLTSAIVLCIKREYHTNSSRQQGQGQGGPAILRRNRHTSAACVRACIFVIKHVTNIK